MLYLKINRFTQRRGSIPRPNAGRADIDPIGRIVLREQVLKTPRGENRAEPICAANK